MKRLIVIGVVAVSAFCTVKFLRPVQTQRIVSSAKEFALLAKAGLESNPVPVIVALGTFLVTVGYHKARGKSFREAVETAATRVAVVRVGESENAVLKRAQARATRAQLLVDQAGLENKLRDLPKQIKQAEKDVSYCEAALTDAEAKREMCRKNHTAAEELLGELREAQAENEWELNEIRSELSKLEAAV